MSPVHISYDVIRMLAYMVPWVVMRARLPYICIWQREPLRECLSPEGLSFRSRPFQSFSHLHQKKIAPGMVSRSVDVKKIVLLGLAAVVLILGNLGIVLVPHWPFSRECVTQSLQSTFPASLTFQKFHSTYFPHPGCIAGGVVFNRLGATPGTPPVVSIPQLVVRSHYLDLIFRPGYLDVIVLDGFRVHIPPMGTPVREPNWQESK